MRVDEVAAQTLAAIRAGGTHRSMRRFEGAQGPRMRVDGREVLVFAGSNYLDLAHHPEVVEAAVRAARDQGCAAGGSRLINGNLALHERLEQEIRAELADEHQAALDAQKQASAAEILEIQEKTQAEIAKTIRSRLLQLASQKRD